MAPRESFISDFKHCDQVPIILTVRHCPLALATGHCRCPGVIRFSVFSTAFQSAIELPEAIDTLPLFQAPFHVPIHQHQLLIYLLSLAFPHNTLNPASCAHLAFLPAGYSVGLWGITSAFGNGPQPKTWNIGNKYPAAWLAESELCWGAQLSRHPLQGCNPVAINAINGNLVVDNAPS